MYFTQVFYHVFYFINELKKLSRSQRNGFYHVGFTVTSTSVTKERDHRHTILKNSVDGSLEQYPA